MIMREPIENEYFNWLCAKVLDVHVHIYHDLLKILHNKEFTWTIGMDKNRAEDGLELRTDFLLETDWERNSAWLNQPCSVFEMLIALSKRACFQTDISERDWFWTFMTNLGLEEYRRVTRPDLREIESIIDTFIERKYDPNGYGGLFPLRCPNHDQREIEIWHQFNEYLEDQGLM